MTPCDLWLRKPCSMLLDVRHTVGNFHLRRAAYLEMEDLVAMAVEGVRADVEKEAEDATS
jgi:hypothetical protein